MNLISQLIFNSWYGKSSITYVLLPFSLLYWVMIQVRILVYKMGILPQFEVGVPVIVVGNLTVGGTGKTPLVIQLVRILVDEGFSPGILSRGYKSKMPIFPHLIEGNESAFTVGDEPLLLHEQTGRPVMIDPDRVRGGRELIKQCGVDIIISDDGLQHTRLSRSIEIIVVDGNRRFGNNCLLPAGPLRESAKHLNKAHFIVANGGTAFSGEYQMKTTVGDAVRLIDGECKMLSDFICKKVHAIAGIGNPAPFFSCLKETGIDIDIHSFSDHHSYRPSDLKALNSATVLMTAKDAIKCRDFAGSDWWAVRQIIELDDRFRIAFLEAIKKQIGNNG